MAYRFIICLLFNIIWGSIELWSLRLNILLSVLKVSPRTQYFIFHIIHRFFHCLRKHTYDPSFFSLTLLLRCHFIRIKLNFNFMYMLPHLKLLRINESFTLSLHSYQNQCKLCYICSHWFLAPIVRIIDRMLST